MKNIKNPKKNSLFLWIVCLSVFLFSGCDSNKWSLFVYPNGNISEKAILSIDAYSSLQECKEGFEFNKRSFPKSSFECGYKCKPQDNELGLYMCEETVD